MTVTARLDALVFSLNKLEDPVPKLATNEEAIKLSDRVVADLSKMKIDRGEALAPEMQKRYFEIEAKFRRKLISQQMTYKKYFKL
jgi:hypothetical protein